MPLGRWGFAIGMCVVATVTAVESHSLLQRLPPSEAGLPPVEDFFDLGPAPAVTCTCVPKPFALTPYRPGWGYGSGPGVPLEDAPLSDADRAGNRKWYAEEDAVERRMVEDAQAGNSSASLSIANHLGLRKIVLGADDRVEAEAVRWLTLAAQQGHQDAFRLLGRRYARGLGVPQSDAAAASWFDQGARHGDPISMTAIGLLFAAGRGVPQDWPSAIGWWERAAAQGGFSTRYLGDAYACGAGVDENHERALALYQRGAHDALSSIQRGYMYVRGCAPPDDKAAVAAFRQAAEEGYPEAQVELSDLLRQGRGGDANPQEAYYWARMAELRLPSGDLKKLATARARAAAQLLAGFLVADGDRMVQDMIASSAKPMR